MGRNGRYVGLFRRLLVVDDLSSALDVDTERVLWERLLGGTLSHAERPTVLAVSHRRVLAASEEMQRLWHDERSA